MISFTGLLTGDMLEVDEFQHSTNDQPLHKVKNKANLPTTFTDLSTPCPKLTQSQHTHKMKPCLTTVHPHPVRDRLHNY